MGLLEVQIFEVAFCRRWHFLPLKYSIQSVSNIFLSPFRSEEADMGWSRYLSETIPCCKMKYCSGVP